MYISSVTGLHNDNTITIDLFFRGAGKNRFPLHPKELL